MSQPIYIANRPITMDDVPLQWIEAYLVTRPDNKYEVHRKSDGWTVEFHGDGTIGFQNTIPNSWMSGCTPEDYNILRYYGWSDRQDGKYHPTFAVAFREREEVSE